mgnify:CR=1 FL=1
MCIRFKIPIHLAEIMSALGEPYISADESPMELTLRVILVGIVLGVLMTAANAYLGLYAGMTVSASIPAAVMSMIILRTLFDDVSILENIKAPFDKMKYEEVIEKLNSMGFDLAWGDDFGYKEEKALTQDLRSPLYITNFPREKGFYHRPDPEDPRSLVCHDLLAPEGYGEIIGGGERVWSPDELTERILEENISSATRIIAAHLGQRQQRMIHFHHHPHPHLGLCQHPRSLHRQQTMHLHQWEQTLRQPCGHRRTCNY